RALRRSSSSLYGGPPGGTARAFECAAAALDPGDGARPVRPAAGLPLLAALPLCHGTVPCRSSAAAGRPRRGAVPLPASSRHSRRPPRQGGGMSSETVVKATDLTRYYQVSRGALRGKAILKALDGASFTVERGKTLAVVGESGCGKSTLARIVTMIEPPTEGSLIISGKEIVGAPRSLLKALRPKVQMIFQNPYGSLNPRQKIGHALEEPLLVNTRMSAAERS